MFNQLIYSYVLKKKRKKFLEKNYPSTRYNAHRWPKY